MKYSKEEIEAEAKRLNVDLSLPYAKTYVLTKLRSCDPVPYGDREPGDASGYTDGFGCLIIRSH